tara:strand:+ start:2750 stop:5671 length:2922 start_codon:yes stop_codon:yes gene_type:complete
MRIRLVDLSKFSFLYIGLLLAVKLLAPPNTFNQIHSKTWAETIFDSLSVDERLAQLFMIEVRPTYGSKHIANVEKLIRDHQVGGVVFFKGNPAEQVKLTNKFQALSKTKMLVAIDGEWGLAMRLSNTISYPYQLGLGGIADNKIIYDMGREIGRQCKRIGIHVNFAPVIDVNNNPNNPVINYRSFGEDPMKVSEKGWAYAKGMQDEGIIACAKHFPGHGDTDVDSHKDLPVINHDMDRLRSVEFKPFEYMIDKGVMSVMTAHLFIPAIDSSRNVAMSISNKAINGLLRREFGFKGLSFTDALNMQGVAKYHPNGELELKALMAGNDVLLAPGDIPKAKMLIKQAMADGRLSEEYVWGKVHKILNFKHAMGLNKFTPISEHNVIKDLNSTTAQHINYQLVEQELCLLNDTNSIIPISKTSNNSILSIAVGNGTINTFQKELKKLGDVDLKTISKNASFNQFDALKVLVGQYDRVIISLHNTSKYPPNFGVTNQTSKFLNQVGQKSNVILVDFGNPYNLKKFNNQNAVLVAYEDQKAHHIKAAQAIFGIHGINGTLPVSVGLAYKASMGKSTHSIQELSSGIPEEVGMSSSKLNQIDNIVSQAIRTRATPGCQVLVVKNGRVVYDKGFGSHTFRNKVNVKKTDLYDLASITKVAATTLSLMKLQEDGELSINDKMVKYLPELISSNKSHMTIKMVLEHKAGLKSWIPFYKRTVMGTPVFDSIYSQTATDTHTYVGNDLYILSSYKKQIRKEILNSELGTVGKYKYSDLGMILMRDLIERVTGVALEYYVDSVFYRPLGVKRMTYLPLNKFKKSEIIPTSISPDMRDGLVHGFVHDPAAAMLGGVSGHAGLFSDSKSLAILMKMLLNGGMYNGVRYLKKETISRFTSKQSRDSRRGIGWDKPEFNRRYINLASDYASSMCFGHTGFTGTMVWADPKYDLIYVFLSNRVYPSQENKKLLRQNVRTNIMDIIYESFLQ